MIDRLPFRQPPSGSFTESVRDVFAASGDNDGMWKRWSDEGNSPVYHEEFESNARPRVRMNSEVGNKIKLER